ncbi:hypothetical protein [Galbibacter mesophilus]|uniref:hypothetical protein n=1 Tax=Galbibacter mesophilus TaxID=379069 RepID=UPI00191F1FD0|nr:hypothetical protein [Galbibacter mesophilus]MCM5663319.1 hypothetical protein [Galbibacter mesophilus]
MIKDNYNRKIKLQCVSCSGTEFDFSEDKTWVKCLNCEIEYNGGYNELLELNKPNVDSAMEQLQRQVLDDTKKQLNNAFKKMKFKL